MIVLTLQMQKLRHGPVEYFAQATKGVQPWMMRGRTPGILSALACPVRRREEDVWG